MYQPPAGARGPQNAGTIESIKKDLEKLRAQWLSLVLPAHTGGAQGLTHLVAHDVTVKAGQTYRYRVVVAMLDPYFMKSQLPDKEKAKYFKMLALLSKPGAASEPVTVGQPSQFFLSRVDAQNATFAVRYLRAGVWQTGTISVRRGFPIAGEVKLGTESVALSNGQILVDVSADSQRIVVQDPAGHLRSVVSSDEQDDLGRFNLMANLGVTHSAGTTPRPGGG
jgi:hypothetical protein